jgi:hypothetical protein
MDNLVFDGSTNYGEVPNDPDFSVSTTGGAERRCLDAARHPHLPHIRQGQGLRALIGQGGRA